MDRILSFKLSNRRSSRGSVGPRVQVKLPLRLRPGRRYVRRSDPTKCMKFVPRRRASPIGGELILRFVLTTAPGMWRFLDA